MEKSEREIAYLMAKHKTEKLKRFYVHLVIYLVVNVTLIVFKVARNLNNGETFSEALIDFSTFSTAIIWGIVLTIHAFSVFGPNVILGRDWEEAKLKKYMKEEEQKQIKKY